uniref:Uncharacterized protein n=1 Tax=Parascaris univalens TaxID=6257 RepID=A0A915A0E6_PARUN
GFFKIGGKSIRDCVCWHYDHRLEHQIFSFVLCGCMSKLCSCKDTMAMCPFPSFCGSRLLFLST